MLSGRAGCLMIEIMRDIGHYHEGLGRIVEDDVALARIAPFPQHHLKPVARSGHADSPLDWLPSHSGPCPHHTRAEPQPRRVAAQYQGHSVSSGEAARFVRPWPIPFRIQARMPWPSMSW